MRWLIALLGLVLLIIIDQTQFNGRYMDQVARLLAKVVR